MSGSKIFNLTTSEAKLLHKINPAIKCPLKVHTRERRIWWVIEKVIGDTIHYPYSICQYCYDNNTSIQNKEKLIPLITSGTSEKHARALAFNCDASSTEDSFNIDVTTDWKMGVYMISPEIKLLKVYDNNNDSNDNNDSNSKNIIIENNLSKFDYAVCFYKKDPNTKKYVIYKLYTESSDTSLNNLTYRTYPDGDQYNITIDSYETYTETPNELATDKYKYNNLSYDVANDKTNNLSVELLTPANVSLFSQAVTGISSVTYTKIFDINIKFKIIDDDFDEIDEYEGNVCSVVTI